MSDLTPRAASSPFDAIRRVRADGSEFWSARDLMPVMGYPRWQDFTPVLDRARASADNQMLDIADLFRVNPEKTGGRPREDLELSRFAAYLVAMNGDPRKAEVAAAQAYFAIRTREAETAAAIGLRTGIAVRDSFGKLLATGLAFTIGDGVLRFEDARVSLFTCASATVTVFSVGVPPQTYGAPVSCIASDGADGSARTDPGAGSCHPVGREAAAEAEPDQPAERRSHDNADG